jgi:hypothetical protein
MRNRSRLTNLVVLAGILALVGCTSARVEYANSHGYDPAWIDGKKYYCSPGLGILGNNSSTPVNCLRLADIDNVRTGKQRPPSPAPATVSDLPDTYRRVLLKGQPRICARTNARVGNVWTCESSLAVAQARAEARNRPLTAASDDGGFFQGDPSAGIGNYGGGSADTSGMH